MCRPAASWPGACRQRGSDEAAGRDTDIAFEGAEIDRGQGLLQGAQAADLGLVDGIAHLVPKMTALYGDKVRLVPLGQKRGLLARFGLSLGEDLLQSVEDRALWARYGL